MTVRTSRYRSVAVEESIAARIGLAGGGLVGVGRVLGAWCMVHGVSLFRESAAGRAGSIPAPPFGGGIAEMAYGGRSVLGARSKG